MASRTLSMAPSSHQIISRIQNGASGGNTMSSSVSVSTFKASSNDDVRNRFLQTIGIEKPTEKDEPGGQQHQQHLKGWTHPRMQNVTPFEVSLKDSRDDERASSRRGKARGSKHSGPLRRKAEKAHQSEKPSKSEKATKAEKKINFKETVEVVPIPLHSEYSNRIRSHLWSSGEEISENALRNTVEYLAEGWNWETVTEDDDMYRCIATGELIHPVHCEPQQEQEHD